MPRHHHSPADAWSEAAAVRDYLARGGELNAVFSPVQLAAGERAVAVFNHYGGFPFVYERYLAAEVTVPGMGPSVIVGSPQFVAGAVAVNTLVRMNARRRAQAQAAWQFRPLPAVGVTLTTQRLWVHVVGAQPLNFNFDTVAKLGQTGNSMTLSFHEVRPLRLMGAWVPWAAEVVAHYLRRVPNVVIERHWPPAAAS
jgi:hypothetical protein